MNRYGQDGGYCPHCGQTRQMNGYAMPQAVLGNHIYGQGSGDSFAASFVRAASSPEGMDALKTLQDEMRQVAPRQVEKP